MMEGTKKWTGEDQAITQKRKTNRPPKSGVCKGEQDKKKKGSPGDSGRNAGVRDNTREHHTEIP